MSVSQKKSMHDKKKVIQSKVFIFLISEQIRSKDFDQKMFNPDAKGCFSLGECKERVGHIKGEQACKAPLFLQLKILFVNKCPR